MTARAPFRLAASVYPFAIYLPLHITHPPPSSHGSMKPDRLPMPIPTKPLIPPVPVKGVFPSFLIHVPMHICHRSSFHCHPSPRAESLSKNPLLGEYGE